MSYDTKPSKKPHKQLPDGLKSERVQREATPEKPTPTGKTDETTSLKSERVQREATGGDGEPGGSAS